MVLLAPTVTALQTLLDVCHAFMLDLMTLYIIKHNENSMYAGSTKGITGSVLNESQSRK